jgi:sugar/nucleoside kinase (ribokinase family)
VHTKILVLNREEAGMLTKGNVRQNLKSLRSLGPRTVIITDGKKGVHMLSKGVYYRIRTRKIKVLESTGAGDAFGAGFLAGYIRKNDCEFALKLGLVNAESVLQHMGAKNRLLRWKEALAETVRAPPVTKTRI